MYLDGRLLDQRYGQPFVDNLFIRLNVRDKVNFKSNLSGFQVEVYFDARQHVVIFDEFCCKLFYTFRCVFRINQLARLTLEAVGKQPLTSFFGAVP